ncbi:hypothetical protein BDY21DRAFT_10636 [Lineolata rhizophorae]|uniref:Uncharacterized protein n=1 Tax=Lineolata rhizophorae TaxID=578093 RepID=A0A6A6PFV1_9PEZI|nr:hypothetical protein BDY21DRAFT_10636 [Lineolata rhizophorae]
MQKVLACDASKSLDQGHTSSAKKGLLHLLSIPPCLHGFGAVLLPLSECIFHEAFHHLPSEEIEIIMMESQTWRFLAALASVPSAPTLLDLQHHGRQRWHQPADDVLGRLVDDLSHSLS